MYTLEHALHWNSLYISPKGSHPAAIKEAELTLRLLPIYNLFNMQPHCEHLNLKNISEFNEYFNVYEKQSLERWFWGELQFGTLSLNA